ncbi:MAG: RNA 2',3'-cyclic phosphodiesterase [bacterium]
MILTIRAFIAIPVDERIRDLASSIVKNLATAGADVKWVEPQNLHLTLKFLGNISTDMIDQVSRILEDAVAGLNEFEVEIEGIGAFPSGKKPLRVVWLGIVDQGRLIEKLSSRIEEGCGKLGFQPEERGFKPHLTIGRVRQGSQNLARLRSAISSVEFNPLKLSVDRVNLMRSELSPRGPTYTVLRTFGLGRK